jgi:hypothetical protein
MDGGPQLRAALDEMRRREPCCNVVFVSNGARGPNIMDARGVAGDWVIEGVLPTGVIAALADLDDPSPAMLLENGFDVVLHFAARGAMADRPVRLSVRWRDGLASELGCAPPPAFWIRLDPASGGFVRVDDEPEAA